MAIRRELTLHEQLCERLTYLSREQKAPMEPDRNIVKSFNKNPININELLKEIHDGDFGIEIYSIAADIYWLNEKIKNGGV